jgi:protein O-mannosyl-transferase
MRRELLIGLILIATTMTVFWQVKNDQFIDLDDHLYVTTNAHVRTGLSVRNVAWAFTTTHAANWHPLTWLSHMVDCQIFGLNAGRHHLTSALIHSANSTLLFLVLTWMTGALWRSALVAALFALHPLHVESVAWISERKDVLSTLFWMLTMWAYLSYVKRPAPGRYLLSLFTFACGLMAKPMLVTLPFVLLLLDYWPLERFQHGHASGDINTANQGSAVSEERRWSAFHLIWEKIPFFALTAASSITTFFAQRSEGAVRSIEQFPLKIRIANAFLSYVRYIGKTIWPQGLAVFYPHPGEALPMGHAVAAGMLLVGITIMVIRARRRYPYLAVGWCWYLGTLVPVIGLVQAGGQALADRYTYVPLIGLFIILAWGVSEFWAKWHQVRILVPIVATLVVLASGVGSWCQLHYWQNSVRLFEHTLQVTTNNSLIHNNLGNVFSEQGRFDEAIGHFNQALEIRPNHPDTHMNLAVALTRQGRFDEAMGHFNQALEIRPNHPDTHMNLAVALMRQGRFEEAVVHFSKALELRPNDPTTHLNLAVALVHLGRVEPAIAHYAKTIELDPNHAIAHNNLGNAFALQGKVDEAASEFSRALEINPNYSEAHNNLGVILARQGKLDQAVAHFSAALRINPAYEQARINLGIALQEKERNNTQPRLNTTP